MKLSIFTLVCIIFVSLTVGASLGIFVTALCVAAKESDRAADNLRKDESSKSEISD